MTYLHAAIAWLASLHPALPYLLVPLTLFGVIYASRRWTPSLWAWLDLRMLPIGKPMSWVIIGLPQVALGAIAGVFVMGTGDYGPVMWAALAAALAPIGHHILKALPGPYDGAAAKIAEAVAKKLQSKDDGDPPAPNGSINSLLTKLLVLLAVCVVVPGCSSAQRDAQSPVAAVVAVSANAVFPTLKEAYIAEGEAEIQQATSLEDAQTRLNAVTKRWRPIWEAWDAFAEAHDVWRVALAADDGAAILRAAAEAREAYCALVRLAPPELPEMPGASCDQNGGAQ